MDINQAAMTALAGYGVMFYAWMEAFIKPTIKTFGNRYRANLLARWFPVEHLSEDAKIITDEAYALFISSVFRVMTVLMGIAFVWGNDIGVSFFDVFNLEEVSQVDEVLNVITTGCAIALGDRGTHFLIDLFEDIFRFVGKKATIK